MHSSNLNWLLAHVREDELRRTAERRARARAGAISGTRSRTTPPADAAVTLRFAFPDDAVALTRLATLDSATPPSDPVLLAEVSGELRAALSLSDGTVIADPFHATASLVELLRARARQLSGDVIRTRRRSLWRRVRVALRPADHAGRPA